MAINNARNVGIYGTGKAASHILGVLESSPHRLVSAISFFENDEGQDIGLITGGTSVGVAVTADLEGAIRSGDFEVLLYAGLSGEVLFHVMTLCAEEGVDLVHACFANPKMQLEPALYDSLQQCTEKSGSRIVSTGMLPGLWLDVVPALLSSALPAPVSITGQACSDITAWGRGVLEGEIGLGCPTEEESGPLGDIMQESAQILAEVLGLNDVTAERRGGFVAAKEEANVLGINVQPGDRIGFDEYSVVVHEGKERVRIGWKGLPGCVFKDFKRSLKIKIIGADGSEIIVNIDTPEDPYAGTAARFVQAIRGIQSLPGGLHTPVRIAI